MRLHLWLQRIVLHWLAMGAIWWCAESTHAIAIRLKTATFDPVVARCAEEPSQTGVQMVQLNQPPTHAHRQALIQFGLTIHGYLPEWTYLVSGTPEAYQRLDRWSFVRWRGAYQANDRIDPETAPLLADDPHRLLYMTLFETTSVKSVKQRVEQHGGTIKSYFSDGPYPALVFAPNAISVEIYAAFYGVRAIEPASVLTRRNTQTSWVLQSNLPNNTPVWERGIRGQAQVLGVIDGELDMSHCLFRDEYDNTPGPNHRKVLAYLGTIGKESHGTHVAGILAGKNVDGSLDNAGMAYEAKLVHTPDYQLLGYSDRTSNLYSLLQQASQAGARIHSNSWGDDTRATYTHWSVDIDRYSWDYEEELLCFACSNLPWLRTPENAKNCLSVSGGDQAPLQNYGCVGPSGPTADGRRKPDLMAPACKIESAKMTQTDWCQFELKSGTSMACPAIAGVAALVRQYFVEGWYPSGQPTSENGLIPTGALLRAMVVNSCVDMTGIVGYPSLREGWGRPLLQDTLCFAGDDLGLFVVDVRNRDGLDTGQEMEFVFEVGFQSMSHPLKVTMVFTDYPAEHAASQAWVNDLDLRLTSPAGEYLGNVFVDGWSVPDTGTPDRINNIEQIHLLAPPAGEYTATVSAYAVNMERQGFALVVSGPVVTVHPTATVVPDSTPTPLVTPIPTASPIWEVPGDVNLDGVLDFRDWVFMAKHYRTLTDPAALADFNHDGKIGSNDLLLLQTLYWPYRREMGRVEE